MGIWSPAPTALNISLQKVASPLLGRVHAGPSATPVEADIRGSIARAPAFANYTTVVHENGCAVDRTYMLGASSRPVTFFLEVLFRNTPFRVTQPREKSHPCLH